MSLLVVSPGPRTLIEDLGRPGAAALGVSTSGAADRGAHALANRLLGNSEQLATLEVLAGGLVLEAQAPTAIAVTGAPAPLVVGGRPASLAAPVYVAAGQRIELGRPESGLRSYVAVLGGIAVEPVLGSRSFDGIAGLGPKPLAAGQVLEVGSRPVSGLDTAFPALALGAASDLAAAAYRLGGPRGSGGPVTARLTATWGPRADWFTAQARAELVRASWQVGTDSDRVGVRCSGPTLKRAIEGELASEPVVRGSVQVPSSGQPVTFLADHPTTGGYPVIAVLDPDSTDLLAQLRPGDLMRIEVRPSRYACDLVL